MVELAILMPLLVMLVFGVFEVGRVLYQEHVISKAAIAGARYLSRKFEVLDDSCTTQAGWTTAVEETRQLTVFAGGDNPLISNMTVDDVAISVKQQPLDAPAEAVCVVRVDVQFPFDGIFGETLVPFTSIGAIILNASAEAVYIGE